VTPDQRGALLSLIAEDLTSFGFAPGSPSGRLTNLGPVYLDDQQPVWTKDEHGRHDPFANILIGFQGDWLRFVDPTLLKKALADLQSDFETSAFGSEMDLPPTVTAFSRGAPQFGAGAEGADVNGPSIGDAISRAQIAAARPWLVPELYCAPNPDTTDIANWIANLEKFLADYETELQLVCGAVVGTTLPQDPAAYRTLIEFLHTAEPTRRAGDSVKVSILDRHKKKPADKDPSWDYRMQLQTSGSPMGPVSAFGLSDAVRRWAGVIHNPLGEAACLKANSDMGNCQLVRLLYLYGTLPAALGSDADLRWRTRTAPGDTFAAFFEQKAADPGLADPALRGRFETARAKLQIVLESAAAHPHASAPWFSPLAGEICKQGLMSWKYWLDEPLRAQNNTLLNAVKAGAGIGDADTEMEFWSENHYIMFASSEYLLGQLWSEESFQPGRLFLAPGDKTGVLTGEQRRQRGRARLLKWLHNKLMFGWAEFHSSGYYREHLWALLNLVDFALDEEIRTKATIVVDLLLFDIVRYQHRGSMGAPGGRSQFKSKNSGWDNDLGDVIEILLGTRGIYNERDAQVACSFATSTYVVPEVLLEIGASRPPNGFTDRSRVSITFDEAPKYGITWSMRSAAKDSAFAGWSSKRDRWFPFLQQVNDELARTHNDYGAVDDDTVFFWGMSAFFNKQNVRNTLHTMSKFNLDKSPAFVPILRTLIEVVLPLIKSVTINPVDAITSGPTKMLTLLLGPAGVLLHVDSVADQLEDESADDLSLFIEGSIRTRANIISYSTPDAMLSSIQNFRTGQLNFQSSVHQATLSTGINVFTTAGFAGLDISDVAAFLGGAFVGGLVGEPIVGGVVGVVLNEKVLKGSNPFGADADEDGPGWWTGYWALPMVAQSGSAAIVAYDFHGIQSFLAETGSHTWFPKSGFDQVVERRTFAYDDANFFLADITDIGPKGFWLFGKSIHAPADPLGEATEGYVGVFSNQRPEWLDKDFGLYKQRQQDKKVDLGDDDVFADHDWYVEAKNVWIVQVGSKAEFGGFEQFMDRVSSARVHLDDSGDLECTYDIPRPDGGSDRLHLAYGDGGQFGINNSTLQVDNYPRFENPFIRGGRVEWGQRQYLIEWNGQSLQHDFTDFARPTRLEAPPDPAEARTVKALVIYLRTFDEDMDLNTVATAAVDIDCAQLTVDQVVACGPVAEQSDHDAEWVFLDRPATMSTDMALELTHPGSVEDSTPEWEAGFALKALMGDLTLRDCTASFASVHFEDERRSSGPLPFSITLSQWAQWAAVPDPRPARFWTVGAHPPQEFCWHEYNDLVLVDTGNRLWHRRLTCGATAGDWEAVDGRGDAPDLGSDSTIAVVSDALRRTNLFALSGGHLLARTRSDTAGWSDPWVQLPVYMEGAPVVTLDRTSTVAARPLTEGFQGAGLLVTAADGNIYSGAFPGIIGPWQKLVVDDFALMPGVPVQAANEMVLALSSTGQLWARPLEPTIFSSWQAVSPDDLVIGRFVAAGAAGVIHLACADTGGAAWIAELPAAGEPTWTRVDGPGATPLHWVTPSAGQWWLLGRDDGTVRSLRRADGDAGPIAWGDAGEPLPADPRQSLIAVSRSIGQFEVFAGVVDGSAIMRTWWS
jgi:hypothetical protein